MGIGASVGCSAVGTWSLPDDAWALKDDPWGWDLYDDEDDDVEGD